MENFNIYKNITADGRLLQSVPRAARLVRVPAAKNKQKNHRPHRGRWRNRDSIPPLRWRRGRSGELASGKAQLLVLELVYIPAFARAGASKWSSRSAAMTVLPSYPLGVPRRRRREPSARRRSRGTLPRPGSHLGASAGAAPNRGRGRPDGCVMLTHGIILCGREHVAAGRPSGSNAAR